MKLSPVGTAELSPGRSPGLEIRKTTSPVGTTEATWRRPPEPFRLEILIPDPITFQSSLRDLSRMHANPGLRPGLSSAVPAGLNLRSVLMPTVVARDVTKGGWVLPCMGRIKKARQGFHVESVARIPGLKRETPRHAGAPFGSSPESCWGEKRRWLVGCCQIHREPMVRVGPLLPELESCSRQQGHYSLVSEFITVFGVDGLASGEGHFPA